MARPRTMANSSWIKYVCIIALSFFTGRATADETGVCACSPAQYTFTLDFSLTCPPVNVTRNPGIAATFCQISPFGDANQTIDDLVPTEIESVGILELGQDFEVLSQQNITSGVFADGDSFEYTSIIMSEGNDKIPKVIQLNVFARNSIGERIVNFYAISYTNNCEQYPSLVEGGSAGWTHFTKLEAPSTAICPAAVVAPTEPPETDPPVEPTDPPTSVDPLPVVPTESPVAPTEAPETDPPIVPTDAPTTAGPEPVDPTDSPVEVPTDPPVENPTDAPVEVPTDPPVEDPTESPVDVVTDAPSPQLTMSMDLLLDELVTTIMSMSMSMHASPSGSYSAKKSKSVKKSKSYKYDKKAKSDKDYSYYKSEKKYSYYKSEKKHKSDKKAKRRRLRVRPLFQAD